MSKNVGVWIDHQKAVVATICDGMEKIDHIESNVEKHVRFGGGSRSRGVPYGTEDVLAEDRIDRRIDQELHRYYKRVIDEISDADRVYLFGRKEARIELEKELRKSKQLGGKLEKTEPADKMTDNQVMAKTRKFFARPRTH